MLFVLLAFHMANSAHAGPSAAAMPACDLTHEAARLRAEETAMDWGDIDLGAANDESISEAEARELAESVNARRDESGLRMIVGNDHNAAAQAGFFTPLDMNTRIVLDDAQGKRGKITHPLSADEAHLFKTEMIRPYTFPLEILKETGGH